MMTHYQIKLAIAAMLLAALCTLLASCLRIERSESGEGVYAADDSVAFAQLERRPMKLPVVPANERCPVSKGSRTAVPAADYIFCAGCFWFGNGPVFLALSWSDQSTDEARFALDRVPYEERAYRAKTPLVSKPDYSGPILIRGRRLDGKGTLRFSVASPRPKENLKLNAPNRTDSTHWSFWPSSMYVPRAGCYGVQTDTSDGTDVIIFEVTGPS
jgi:hypothetical protein